MLSIIITILGWIGMFLLTIGFYFVSSGKIKGTSLLYLITQSIGCFLVGINSFYNGAYPSVLVQIVCLIIAFKAISVVIKEKTEKLENFGKE